MTFRRTGSALACAAAAWLLTSCGGSALRDARSGSGAAAPLIPDVASPTEPRAAPAVSRKKAAPLEAAKAVSARPAAGRATPASKGSRPVGSGSSPRVPAPVWLGFQDDESFRWGGSRAAMLDRAARAQATIVRTNVYWYQVAAERPANARDPFDPAYRFDDLDELVRNAQQRGLSVLLTIWGTPTWANGGLKPNHPPLRPADLGDFAHALALRYSGQFAGYPYVGFYSVWNEPNLEQFLAPQFDSRGRPVAPALYARLYQAAYAGVKSGNRRALVGIGETSPRGRDRVTTARTQQTESPGRFAQLLAQTAPGLRFDAWAHHPYPIVPSGPPTQRARWPNVTLRELPRFEQALDGWFKRRNIPIWITEYAYQSRPPGTLGVPVAQQAAYLRQALMRMGRDARVRMIIWFTFRDESSNLWKSGLITEDGATKPSFQAFAQVAGSLGARNLAVAVSSRTAVQRVRLPALTIAYYSGVGARVGLTYRVLAGRRLLTIDQAAVQVARDGWVTLPVRFRPEAGLRYGLVVSGSDAHGNELNARRVLVAVR